MACGQHVEDTAWGARYRFGAPLDPRWLAGGWSAHLEHVRDGLRLRTDFVTRPPRLSPAALDRLWLDADAAGSDVVAIEPLVRMKMTRREKDYAVIGKLARRLEAPRSQLLFSRSSRDLIRLARAHPDALSAAMTERPVLAHVDEGRDALDAALDRERRLLMRPTRRGSRGIAPPQRRGPRRGPTCPGRPPVCRCRTRTA